MSQMQREQLKVMSERAVLVAVQLPGDYVDEHDVFGELRSLAQTAGAVVVGELVQRRSRPAGRTYLGKGKVEELKGLIDLTDATLVAFDNDLTPAQIRALEHDTSCKIVDRSELILDIFANRATTKAAKLQVEIAQLEYTYPRLRAMWDHLGQVVGGAPVGIGTRGPGEQQLEIDRRLVQRRLKQLRHELEEVQERKTREVRKRTLDHFTVGLVGYTNAGKSTLFNRLTAGGAFEHSKLFATLSTRIERWDLGGGNSAMLSDTVGFIRDLPHHLVASFRSTLEETVHAHLLVLVLDVSDPNAEMQLRTVMETLDEIGATSQRRLVALNKIDQIGSTDLLVWMNRHPDAFPLSAQTGEGTDELRRAVLEEMVGEQREVVLTLPLSAARAIAFLEKRAAVQDRAYTEDEVRLQVRIGRRQIDQLLAQGAPIRVNGVAGRDGVRRAWEENGEWSQLRDADDPPPHERFYSKPARPEAD